MPSRAKWLAEAESYAVIDELDVEREVAAAAAKRLRGVPANFARAARLGSSLGSFAARTRARKRSEIVGAWADEVIKDARVQERRLRMAGLGPEADW